MTRRPLGRPYSLLAASSLASTFGDGLRYVAMPLLAVSLGGTVTDVALITMAGTLPWLLFGLPVGVIVDRRNKRWVMIISDGARFVLAVATVAAVAAHIMTLAALGIVAFGMGVGEVFYDCASMTILPMLVDTSQLTRANGRLYALQNLGRNFIGFALGGPLYVIWRGLPLALDALSFLASAVLLRTIGGAHVEQRAPAAAAVPPAPLAAIRRGLTELAGSRLLIAFTFLAATVNFVFMGQNAILAPFVLHHLRLPAAVYGGFLVASAIGAVLGGFLAARLAPVLGEGRTLVLCLAVFAVASGAIGSSPVVLVVVCFMLSGGVLAVYNAISVSVRQRLVPPGVLGTVTGAYRMITWGSMPAGAAVYGLLASAWGMSLTFLVGGVLVAAATLACSRALLKLALSASPESSRLDPVSPR